MDENQVFQYVGGLLSSTEERVVEEHVARCDACRWMLSAAGAAVLDDVPTGEATQQKDGQTAGLPAARRIGEVLQDTYVVERFIGQGGTGVVYEAAHRRLPRRFAIKFLSSAFAADRVAVARIKREAEVTSRLSHPNIVDVVDFNAADDGTPFIVMELLQGEPLAERLRREGAITSLAEVAQIIQPVASALGAAHDSGVVHRDLKPSNIFLCREPDGRTVVKVVDFGIAKVVAPDEDWDAHSQLTRVCAVVGTPTYMSPEQAEGRSAEVDQRADVFALGAILFRMVAGVLPFKATSVEETLQLVSSGRPAQTGQWRAVPSRLRRVILRAMHKDPARRQRSMSELWQEVSAALRGLVAGERGFTAEVSPSRAAAPRRRPLSAFLGLAALLLIVGGLVTYLSLRPSVSGDAKTRANGDAVPSADAAQRLAFAPRDAGGAIVDVGGVEGHDLPLDVRSGRADLRKVRVVTRRPVRPRPARGWGSIVVQSKEQATGRYVWAYVFLDDRRVGQTALTLEKIRRGTHIVRVQRPGYASAEQRISVSPGKQTVVRFALRRLAQ